MKPNEIMGSVYKDSALQVNSFYEQIESEFHSVVKKYNLPLDREAIAAAGIVVEYDNSCPGQSSATITRNGKSISRTIRMNDSVVDSRCLAHELKAKLMTDGVLCEVLDDLKRMTEDATKTLQELLDAPARGDFNCTEISVDTESNLINRVMCLGKEYKA